MAGATWKQIESLFIQEDESFVAELRQIHDPENLGAFAKRWIADNRPFARRKLIEYLSLPLNCYRHEPLVKRLFKLAEAAQDDELMGLFAVALDRSIRRRRKPINVNMLMQFPTRAAAEAMIRQWENDGFRNGSIYPAGPNKSMFNAYAFKVKEFNLTPRDRMPVPRRQREKPIKLDQYYRGRFEKKYVLFSIPTRRYLRRRAWRYFRLIGKKDPARCIKSVSSFLIRYTDADIDSPIHLLDNWALINALFRDSPALIRPAKGWAFLPGKEIGDLSFAPYLADVWKANPELLLKLLFEANCRTVRLFAVRQLESIVGQHPSLFTASTLLKIVDHPDPDVSAFGLRLFDSSTVFANVSLAEWLERLDGVDPDRLARLLVLLQRRLDRDTLSVANAVALTRHRFSLVARFGFEILKDKSPTRTDVPALLALTQAECDDVRPQLIEWLWKQLVVQSAVEPETILEFLDSKYADVRLFGWNQFRQSELSKDVVLWQQLTESPYPDVRHQISSMLSQFINATDTPSLTYLWASVLCSIHGGSRQKPGIVAKIVERINQDSADAEALLPLLALAVRSLRGPEFRAGLSGLMTLCETKPELAPLIRRQFPELTF